MENLVRPIEVLDRRRQRHTRLRCHLVFITFASPRHQSLLNEIQHTVPFQRRRSYYENADNHAVSHGVAADAVDRVEQAWRKLGYRVVRDPALPTHVYADRYREKFPGKEPPPPTDND